VFNVFARTLSGVPDQYWQTTAEIRASVVCQDSELSSGRLRRDTADWTTKFVDEGDSEGMQIGIYPSLKVTGTFRSRWLCPEYEEAT
jgi:hypothetical protein